MRTKNCPFGVVALTHQFVVHSLSNTDLYAETIRWWSLLKLTDILLYLWRWRCQTREAVSSTDESNNWDCNHWQSKYCPFPLRRLSGDSSLSTQARLASCLHLTTFKLYQIPCPGVRIWNIQHFSCSILVENYIRSSLSSWWQIHCGRQAEGKHLG